MTSDYRIYLSPNQIQKLKSCNENRIDCTIRFNLAEKTNNTIKLTDAQIEEIRKCKKLKKKYCEIKFSPKQIGGFLPALIPVAIAVAKALGLGAVGYAGAKLAKKISGDGINPKKKKVPQSKTYGQGNKLIGKTYGQGNKLIGKGIKLI